MKWTGPKYATSFANIEAYWRDPKPFDVEIAANRRTVNAAIDAGMKQHNERQQRSWQGEL